MTKIRKDLPNVEPDQFRRPDTKALTRSSGDRTPKILLLYGSLRQCSFSRLATEDAARRLQAMGTETRIFNPSGLPLPDDSDENHPKGQELREPVQWCEGMVSCSPERHGAMTSVMKVQLDWIPLSIGTVRPTQGVGAAEAIARIRELCPKAFSLAAQQEYITQFAS